MERIDRLGARRAMLRTHVNASIVDGDEQDEELKLSMLV